MQERNLPPSNSQDQLLPHSAETEAAALGCVLYQAGNDQPRDAGKMLGQLKQGYFYELRHREVFSALRCLSLDEKPLDAATVRQWLSDKGRMEGAGGPGYLFSLPDNAIPAAFSSYLETLREKASRRELVKLGTDAVKLACDEAQDVSALSAQFSEMAAQIMENGDDRGNWIRFYTPSECRDYRPPDGFILVGDCHIVRGAVTVIGGPPGVGKSRASIALAMAGATRKDWYGLNVHAHFKALIIQNENGRYRLSKDFAGVQGTDLDNFIRVSEPPANGMAFDRLEFQAALSECIREFKPDVVAFDPWNSAARDDRQRDYLETFEAIRKVLPKGDDAPALVIIAHTRKPRADERASGRSLLNMLAGSYVLGSVPRCVFVMQPASDDVTDDRIVWTCCKNNDGNLGDRSAWFRRDGMFEPCPDFDWQAFDGSGEKRRTVTLEDLASLFDNGDRKIAKAIAVTELKEATGMAKTACYQALKLDGKFAANLSEKDGLIGFKP